MLLSRKLAVLAAAIVMGAVCASAPAAEAEADSRAKKQALIRLLVRAGKSEEAAAAMRSLYPKGPPYGGELVIEYYDVIGNTESGWEEVRAGLEKLVKAAPEDMSYQLALARHLSRRPDTRRRGLKMFGSLADKKGIDRKQVLGEWRDALDRLSYNAESIALYKEYLAVDPDNASIRDTLASAQRAEAAKLPWQMRDTADAQLAEGRPEAARETLQRALQLDPKNAWVRFDLARLDHKGGDVKRGRELMESGLSVAPGDADMLYANALYISLLDEQENALRLLDKIPPKERSAGTRRLRKKIEVTLQTRQALAQSRAGKTGDMQVAMRRAEIDAGKDPELLSIVANGWIDLKNSRRGVGLMRRAVARSPQTDALIHYAKVLNRAEENDELATVLAKLDAAKGLSPGDKADLRYLHSSLASHRADSLRQQGKVAEARGVLVAALGQYPDDTDMLMALARVHVAAGEEQQARDIYRGILQRTPGETGAQHALDRMTADADDKATRAEGRPGAVLVPGDDIGARLAVADGYIGMGDTATAGAIIDQLKKAAPDDPRVLVQAGRLARAEGNYEEALDYFRRANATEETTEMERGRAHGYVAGGIDYLSKLGGVAGISNLTVVEAPIEMRIPVGYNGGRLFAQVTPSYADASALQLGDLYDLRQYGKVLALAPNGIANSPGQSARGTSLALGYDRDGLRVDIGSTPIGFPVSNVVGGAKWSHYTADSGFSLDISRRPITSSVVSYAGARDPVSGDVWGGVTSTGAGLHLSHDIGRLSGFIEPGYYVLTGTNVLTNTEAALRAGFNWSFIDRDDMRLTAGVVGTYWHYRENERFYTFGMGGYYSPQKYYSAAIPARWTGREESWSYMLQGSVSISATYERNMPFYPTDPALQAQAVANTNLSTATYAGGPGHGTGYSLGGAVEHRLSPRLFAGVVAQIDRSAYYTPNYAIAYLRYNFDALTGPMTFPPEPVKTYSRF